MTNLESTYRYSMVLTAELISKGYHFWFLVLSDFFTEGKSHFRIYPYHPRGTYQHISVRGYSH